MCLVKCLLDVLASFVFHNDAFLVDDDGLDEKQPYIVVHSVSHQHRYHCHCNHCWPTDKWHPMPKNAIQIILDRHPVNEDLLVGISLCIHQFDTNSRLVPMF